MTRYAACFSVSRLFSSIAGPWSPKSPPPLTCSFPLFYSDLYKFPLPPTHRFPMHKYSLVRAALQSHPLLYSASFSPAPLATRAELELAHSRAYIDAFLRGTLSAADVRAIGLPWTVAGVRRALGSTGGTVAAARAVLRGEARLAGHTAGGTHHARRARGGGFCVFNDLAVAARVAAAEFGVRRVLVVDLDVHQGDGSAEILRRHAGAYTVSVHAEGNYPFVKEVSDVDVGLRDGVGDEEFVAVVREVVDEAMQAARPGLVLLQMGVDGLEEDALGRLALTRAGLSRRNMAVYEAVLRRGVPCVVTMGGGYSRPSIGPSVAAHCDVYIDAARALATW